MTQPVPPACVLPAQERGLCGPAAAAHRHLSHHGSPVASAYLCGAASATAGRLQREEPTQEVGGGAL